VGREEIYFMSFNIASIPTNVLIDKEGKVLEWNLTGEKLTETLSEIFSKK